MNPPPEASKLLLEVADAAEALWRSRRPWGWSKKKHIKNPTVNTNSQAEVALAKAVAAWKQIGG